MFSEAMIELSRLQFAATSMYHFIFVPLTLGLSFMLVVMEACYLVTGKEAYKDMTKFWGKLFGINFALGVATGITMEFQFGTNWAYYSHYVGDIFGAPLAIEGLMAFFLESTFIGLFFFGWTRLKKGTHFIVTLMMALGSNLSALWILIANAWMQYPIGSEFNFETMRMEMTDFFAVILSPWAQAKFGHTIAAGYMTGALFVLAISAYYLLKGRDIDFAKRSLRIAAAFGLVVSLFTIHLGDESGYLVAKDQPAKMAAMEAAWETHPAPAPMTVFGFPDEATQTTRFNVEIPWLFGIIATRSLDTPIPGIKDIVAENTTRIENGVHALETLSALRRDPNNAVLREQFSEVQKDLGYGMLLRKYTDEPSRATEEMISQAAKDTIPNVNIMFWSFRAMVGCGIALLLIFALNLYFSVKGSIVSKRTLLKLTFFALPLPWIACELGWLVAEYGRQPWSIYEVLPTHLSTSTLSASSVMGSLIGFVVLYSALLVVEMWLMKRLVKTGPSFLGTGRYFFEQNQTNGKGE